MDHGPSYSMLAWSCLRDEQNEAWGGIDSVDQHDASGWRSAVSRPLSEGVLDAEPDLPRRRSIDGLGNI